MEIQKEQRYAPAAGFQEGRPTARSEFQATPSDLYHTRHPSKGSRLTTCRSSVAEALVRVAHMRSPGLVEKWGRALCTELGIPRADLGPFPTGSTLRGAFGVRRSPVAHSPAVVDLVGL